MDVIPRGAKLCISELPNYPTNGTCFINNENTWLGYKSIPRGAKLCISESQHMVSPTMHFWVTTYLESPTMHFWVTTYLESPTMHFWVTTYLESPNMYFWVTTYLESPNMHFWVTTFPNEWKYMVGIMKIHSWGTRDNRQHVWKPEIESILSKTNSSSSSLSMVWKMIPLRHEYVIRRKHVSCH